MLENKIGELGNVAGKLARAGVDLQAVYVVGLDGDLVELALAVDDIKNVRIDGLAGREFQDKTDSMRRKTQGKDKIEIVGETDRVVRLVSGRVEEAQPSSAVPAGAD